MSSHDSDLKEALVGCSAYFNPTVECGHVYYDKNVDTQAGMGILQMYANLWFNSNGSMSTFVMHSPSQAHLHHYCGVDGMDVSMFEDSLSSVITLIDEYEALQATAGNLTVELPRLKLC